MCVCVRVCVSSARFTIGDESAGLFTRTDVAADVIVVAAMCVCIRERQRERKCVCVCVCV